MVIEFDLFVNSRARQVKSAFDWLREKVFYGAARTVRREKRGTGLSVHVYLGMRATGQWHSRKVA